MSKRSFAAASLAIMAACQVRAPASGQHRTDPAAPMASSRDASDSGDAGLAALVEVGSRPETAGPSANEDPLVVWLRSEQLSVRQVKRDASRVTAFIRPHPVPSTTARLAYVRAFAERAARAEGLPALDTVDLVPPDSKLTDANLLDTRFLRLELRLAKPPLDGACIDPRAIVDVSESGDGAGFSLVYLQLVCEKARIDGRRAPPDASRRLPAAAAGHLPFLAICEYVNFAWGYDHDGYVIDKRGDVYAFSGGPVLSGKSIHGLRMMLRHSQTYAGTIPAAEADRLVALAPSVAREPFKKQHLDMFDAPGGGCSLLRLGGKDDALVSTELSSIGREEGSRVGPASTSAQLVLAAARKLVDAAPAISIAPEPGTPCRPFDRRAAGLALSHPNPNQCRVPDGPRGVGHARITFAPDGSVRTVTIDGGPFVDTPTGACVAERYRSSTVPAFCPGDVSVGKEFDIQ